MKALALITARGGSKRIPRKNIKDFNGKPIIAYSIEAALGSGVFDEVMVSTDDEEIAEISRYYGAQVPFLRSEKTSNDYATTSDVINEVISEYEKRGRRFDILTCIYPTAPFTLNLPVITQSESLAGEKNAAVAAYVTRRDGVQRTRRVCGLSFSLRFPLYRSAAETAVYS